MSEMVLGQLVTLGSAIFGAMAGYFVATKTTERALTSARAKDNFEIKDREFRLRLEALCKLQTATDSYTTPARLGGGDSSSAECGIKLVREVYLCIFAAYWAFPEHVRLMGRELQKKLHLIELEWHGQHNAASRQSEQTRVAQELVIRNKVVVLTNDLIKIRTAVEEEMNRLTVKYENYRCRGIVDCDTTVF